MSQPRVNAVIVGSGAGGAIVAKKLSEGGLRVVVLERGRFLHTQDASHDILFSQYDNSGPLGFGPDINANPRTFRLTSGEPAKVVYPNEHGYGRTAACVGGGTTPYGAMAWRFAEKDFQMKSLYGVPSGTTVDDWPITYDDLEPYYTQAEYEIGVSGQGGRNPFESHRSKPYPLPPLAYDNPAEIFIRAANKLGLHPFPVPLAIVSQPYDGRPPCIRCVYCVRFQCEVAAKSTMHVTMIPKALATRLCEVRSGCMAREVTVDERGRARSVIYFGPDKKLYEQPADLVVISCSATESCRLLLNSKSKLFPTGLANRYDQVGRNIMDHSGGASLMGLFEEDVFDPRGPGYTAAVADYVHAGGALLNGSMISTNLQPLPLVFARSCDGRLGPHPWGKEAKAFVRKYFRHVIALYAPGTGMPTENNRVDLDPSVRDEWGIPVLRVTHRAHPIDVRSSYFLRNRMIEILRAAGAREEFLPPPATEEAIDQATRNITRGGLGEHQAGGCRMGNDPRTSVVTRHCQLHDVDNVFVADASVFPSIGGFNPSLTIQANAFRVSAHIIKEWRGGSFRSPS
jgi:choline dehydrogenase-like flavoprotein